MYKKGFTLIELLAVIAIIGIVVPLVVVSIMGTSDNVKNKLSETETKNLTEAGKMLALDLNDSLSDLYNCKSGSWIVKKCKMVSGKWSYVKVTVKDLKDNGYFTDNENHIAESRKVTIKSNYTVTIGS